MNNTSLLYSVRHTGETYPWQFRNCPSPPLHEHRFTRAPVKSLQHPDEYDYRENPERSVKELKTLMLLATVWRDTKRLEQLSAGQLAIKEKGEEDEGPASPIGDLDEPWMLPEQRLIEGAPEEGKTMETLARSASPFTNLDEAKFPHDVETSGRPVDTSIFDLDEAFARDEAFEAVERHKITQRNAHTLSPREEETLRGIRGAYNQSESIQVCEESGPSANEEATSSEVHLESTPAVRRSLRLSEKRRASDEIDGDAKRRKDSSWDDIEVEEMDVDEQ